MKTSPVIAIIEDEPAIQEMYRIKLELSGFKAVTAHNGVEGLELITKEKPDLVLLDIKMPIMTGDEMLERLRRTKAGAEVPVIILTNISKDEAPHNLRLLRVTRYVVKAHYTPAQVVAMVKEILGITQ